MGERNRLRLLQARFVNRQLAAAVMLGVIAGEIGLRQHFAAVVVMGVDLRQARAGADTMQLAFPQETVVVNGGDDALHDVAGVPYAAIGQQ